MPNLSALESKYFIPGIGAGGAFTGNTKVEPLIDGVSYFDRIYQEISKTKDNNDLIYIVTWEIDPDWDISKSSPPYPTPIGQLLTDKAAAGVDVRIILNGTLYLHYTGVAPAWKENLEAVERLRAWRPSFSATAPPPLAQAVLYDWSGANLSGSHHQKAWVVRSGMGLVAFVGGMNIVPNHRDKVPHTAKTWPDGKPWGWHDIGVELRGAAAIGVWENFRQRWHEASTLPNRGYLKVLAGASPGTYTFVPVPLNPPVVVATPTTAPTDPAPLSASHSVRILRSRFWHKIPDRLTLNSSGTSWAGPPTYGIYEVMQVLRRAIAEAKRYIYIEDQFLEDQLMVEQMLPNFSLYPALEAAISSNPNLKVIFVGSGRADPDDPFFIRGIDGYKNRELTHGIRELIITPLQPLGLHTNVAVWRLENATVHSKLVMIDDEFISIGSANFQSRSMFGVDDELQAVIVADDNLIQRFRVDLWSEHLRLSKPLPQGLATSLEYLDTALGLWRSGWYVTDPGLWWSSNHPTGFTGHGALAFVGPET